MGESRISKAIARIDAALERMESAQAAAMAKSASKTEKDGAGSARVMALVNSHEKLREEVADTLRDLDSLIDELESDNA
ncbi:MAG: hypothetical protein SXU28_09045 [Pseudomonadota bacterium]|nr:hypothetical protein [Pseudomonadota bacterium]